MSMKQLEVHYLTTFNFNLYADTPARPCAGIDVGNLKITVFYTVVMLLTFILVITSIPSPLTLSFQA